MLLFYSIVMLMVKFMFYVMYLHNFPNLISGGKPNCMSGIINDKHMPS
jgi:hypothetical protein